MRLKRHLGRLALATSLVACSATRSKAPLQGNLAGTEGGADASGQATSMYGMGKVELQPPGRAGVTVRVDVADTPSERAQGLMYRRELPADSGMLFLFEQPERQSFWMKNTYVPLDMIFIGADWRVVGVVENTTPLSERPVGVDAPSKYVLEVNAGFSGRNAIATGTLVQYVPASK